MKSFDIEIIPNIKKVNIKTDDNIKSTKNTSKVIKTPKSVKNR